MFPLQTPINTPMPKGSYGKLATGQCQLKTQLLQMLFCPSWQWVFEGRHALEKRKDEEGLINMKEQNKRIMLTSNTAICVPEYFVVCICRTSLVLIRTDV